MPEMVRGLGIHRSYMKRGGKVREGQETKGGGGVGGLPITDRNTVRPPLSSRANLNPTHPLIPLLWVPEHPLTHTHAVPTSCISPLSSLCFLNWRMACNTQWAGRALITGLSYQVAPLLRCREVSRSPAFLSEFVTVSDSRHDVLQGGRRRNERVGWEVEERRILRAKTKQLKWCWDNILGLKRWSRSGEKKDVQYFMCSVTELCGWRDLEVGGDKYHTMKNLCLELFIHGGTVRDGDGVQNRRWRLGENLLTVTQETDSICHLLRWKWFYLRWMHLTFVLHVP